MTFFFLLHWSNIIQITMCFTEVVDLIFSYHLLNAYCVAGTVQRTLPAIPLLILKRLTSTVIISISQMKNWGTVRVRRLLTLPQFLSEGLGI